MKVQDMLKAPRVPRECPVSFLHIVTVRRRGGAAYGAHAWIIQDHTGQLVEIIEGDDSIESLVWARWPWASTQNSARFGIRSQTWPTTVHVDSAEFKRIAGWEPWTENGAKLRAMADRCQRYNAVRDAINSLHTNSDPTTIYHRTPENGGDHVSVAIRDAMRALVSAGMAERVHDPDGMMPDGRTRQDDYVGQYRRTDTTPQYS